MGFDERQDIISVQTKFRMRDQILGQGIDAGLPTVGIGGQRWQLPVKTPGKIQQDVADVTLQDIFVIQYPVGGRCGFLLQAAGHGKVRTDLTHPQTGSFQTPEQFGGMLRQRVHLLLSGMALGMFKDLRR